MAIRFFFQRRNKFASQPAESVMPVAAFIFYYLLCKFPLHVVSNRQLRFSVYFVERILHYLLTSSFWYTVCVPGIPIDRKASLIKANVCKPLQSNYGAAINKTGICRTPFLYYISNYTAGGSACFFRVAPSSLIQIFMSLSKTVSTVALHWDLKYARQPILHVRILFIQFGSNFESMWKSHFFVLKPPSMDLIQFTKWDFLTNYGVGSIAGTANW